MDPDKENCPSAVEQAVDTVAETVPEELRLRAIAGPSSNTEYSKPGVLKLSVGRTRASKIWIKDSAVSEKHAQASGEPTILKHGDVIKFGTDSILELEVNPVLDENVTVQQYLESEARKQAQCIRAKCEQQASQLQEAWQNRKAELLQMKAAL